MKELIEIQSRLNAPKNNYNSVGKYKYRSCEDILAAVKPLLKEQQCTLTLWDDIILLGDRYYIKATATIKNSNGETETTTACAREEFDKKGMDASQITGTASSYARKYALNGLFAIDDTKDADALNINTEYTTSPHLQWREQLAKCKTVADVETVWRQNASLQKNEEFKQAVIGRQIEVK